MFLDNSKGFFLKIKFVDGFVMRACLSFEEIGVFVKNLDMTVVYSVEMEAMS